jgi:protein-S-isoprenylcysteine O-methyltransferase Ste14
MKSSAHRHPFALRVPPLLVALAFGVLGWLIASATPRLTFSHASQPWVAAALVLAGIVVSVAGVISFRRARTTVNPLKPDAATALVVSGIYRATRNPMYLGFLFLLLAAVAWLGNLAALLTIPLFVHYLNRFQIAPEEEALRRQFGRAFENYASGVRRWI